MKVVSKQVDPGVDDLGWLDISAGGTLIGKVLSVGDPETLPPNTQKNTEYWKFNGNALLAIRAGQSQVADLTFESSDASEDPDPIQTLDDTNLGTNPVQWTNVENPTWGSETGVVEGSTNLRLYGPDGGEPEMSFAFKFEGTNPVELDNLQWRAVTSISNPSFWFGTYNDPPATLIVVGTAMTAITSFGTEGEDHRAVAMPVGVDLPT